MKHDDASVQQTNEGNEQRIAGRDFNDYSSLYYTDIKLFMLTSTEDKLDALSIENGRHFIYRFGQDFEEKIRQDIIALKLQHHFTEREVKNLLATWGISVNKLTSTVKLCKDLFIYYLGWLLIAFIIIEGTLNILMVALTPHSPVWYQALAQFSIGGICIGVVWVFNWLYIKPYHTLLRAKSVV
ncbi:MAG: hypothetical protein BVN34_00920 [Proteobacteria bacterium ST_bin12]|nr:MAG: hypothetical protein BVN34_00920 [Proteobacteria bacterium ST_bin12]